MIKHGTILTGLLAIAVSGGLAAHSAQPEVFKLRPRLSDPVLEKITASNFLALRPRVEPIKSALAQTEWPADTWTVPIQTDLDFIDSGTVGKFAYMPTPLPDVQLAVGAAHDLSETGRQIDRAIAELDRGAVFFDNRRDIAPFVGLGLRKRSGSGSMSFDASIGAGLLNGPEASRLSQLDLDNSRDDYQVEGRANIRFSLTF